MSAEERKKDNERVIISKGISIIVKHKKEKCLRCFKDKEYSEFHVCKRRKTGITNICKSCYSQVGKYKYENDNGKIKKQSLIRANKTVANLGDSYIKDLLRGKGFLNDKITPELIGIQRLLIKAHREIKNQTK